MRSLTTAAAAALALVSSCNAVNLIVKSSGGNASSPLTYGIMHEVSRTLDPTRQHRADI
jgi:alpha-N-arabinofuranosidase